MESTQEIRAEFEIVGWDPEPYEREGTASELTKVRVRKRFSGEIVGTSDAELLMASNPVGAGYVGSELFIGTVAGRDGSFVFQHWGVAEGAASVADGYVVPGSGTGALEPMRGNVKISQDQDGQHYITLNVSFAGGIEEMV
ncbi:DUF3224 domain-containing protein [Haematomicrobium sanguinis]|uniref:DUF3224 domain-containing protein n=1 Tax=Haematomicrobium sanguinis TaxID=479106 RepID=UPI000479D128|nr:DUF3224 domain-containing protein [Haematomicrobium sanguinis]